MSHNVDEYLSQDLRFSTLVALAEPVRRPCGWSIFRPVRRSRRLGRCSHLPNRIKSCCVPWRFSRLGLRTCILRLGTPWRFLADLATCRRHRKQQLGNMVSSSAAQIESVAGDNIKTKDGKPDYGKIGAILIGVRIRQLSDGRKYLR